MRQNGCAPAVSGWLEVDLGRTEAGPLLPLRLARSEDPVERESSPPRKESRPMDALRGCTLTRSFSVMLGKTPLLISKALALRLRWIHQLQ